MTPQRIKELYNLVRQVGCKGVWLTSAELRYLLNVAETIPRDPLVCLANLGPSVPDPMVPEGGSSIRA